MFFYLNFIFGFKCVNFTFKVIAYQTTDTVVPYITGSDFGSEVFFLLQLHFHWGYNTFVGSEHQIDSKAYPLEVY